MSINNYEKELTILLKPIKYNSLTGWASMAHGHIQSDDGRDFLPWYYLRYKFEKANKEEIYDKYFSKFEQDGGNKLTEYNYRYYDVSLFKQVLGDKLKPIDRSIELLELAEKCGKENCFFELNDSNTYCKFQYKNKDNTFTLGMSPITKEFIQEFKNNGINL